MQKIHKTKLLAVLLLNIIIVGCNQDQNNHQQSNLDTPEVVTKNTTKTPAKVSQFLSPLRDSNTDQMIVGYNQSINSFAPMQCFTYTTAASGMKSDATLGVAETSSDVQKKLGIDTSVKVKVSTFHLSDKNDITTTSSNFSNSIRVYYTAYTGGNLTNNISGLTDQGKALFKAGLPTFAANCGSSYINNFAAYLYTVFYFDISSSDTKTMDSIKNQAKAKVSFLTLMNTVNSSTSSNNSTVSIQAGISNYGGTLDDAGKIVAITGPLLSSSNLVNCLAKPSNTGPCSDFISKDVGNAIDQVTSILSSETAQKNYSGLYPDFGDVSNNVTQIAGAMIGEKKTKTIPDPYINYKLLNAANVAQDLSIAATNASALSTLISGAGSLNASLQFAPSQLSNNAKAYSSAAEPIWQSIKTCLSNVTSCSQVGSPSIVTSLSNNQQALTGLYSQAYQITENVLGKDSDINSIPESSLPMILLFNSGNAYLFEPANPSGAISLQFAGIANFTQLNSNLAGVNSLNGFMYNVPNSNSSICTAVGTCKPQSFYAADSSALITPATLQCNLLNMTQSCSVNIMPNINEAAYPGWYYTTISINSPFLTLTLTQ